MKKTILIIIALTLTGCYESLHNFFYPADEYLDLGDGREVRLHCLSSCPPHEDIRTAMRLVSRQIQPHLSYDVYSRWKHYSITFNDEILTYNGQQVLGATLHNLPAIVIWTGYECDGPKGICSGVIGYELKLAAIERELPMSTEAEKIKWLTDRGIQNIQWSKSDFQQ